jgi:N-acylneuraminate cytidylyltransferase
MSTVAIIPARGGSKGIKDKNTKIVAGKPLIEWSISQALQSKLISKVIVSTDCTKIALCARNAGAEVPFVRPASLSDDYATTESVMMHFCDWLLDTDQKFENILLIQATSPIRAMGRIDDAIRFFEAGGYDSLLSVSPTHRFFWTNQNKPTASYDYFNRPRRQEISGDKRQFVETGSLYITKIDALLKNKNRLCGKIGMYITPESESYEIDSLLDLKVCESILLALEGEY